MHEAEAVEHKAESGGGGLKHALTKKYGPAPLWVYLGLGTAAVWFLFMRGHSSTSSAGYSDAGSSLGGGSGDSGPAVPGLPPVGGIPVIDDPPSLWQPISSVPPPPDVSPASGSTSVPTGPITWAPGFGPGGWIGPGPAPWEVQPTVTATSDPAPAPSAMPSATAYPQPFSPDPSPTPIAQQPSDAGLVKDTSGNWVTPEQLAASWFGAGASAQASGAGPGAAKTQGPSVIMPQDINPASTFLEPITSTELQGPQLPTTGGGGKRI